MDRVWSYSALPDAGQASHLAPGADPLRNSSVCRPPICLCLFSLPGALLRAALRMAAKEIHTLVRLLQLLLGVPSALAPAAVLPLSTPLWSKRALGLPCRPTVTPAGFLLLRASSHPVSSCCPLLLAETKPPRSAGGMRGCTEGLACSKATRLLCSFAHLPVCLHRALLVSSEDFPSSSSMTTVWSILCPKGDKVGCYYSPTTPPNFFFSQVSLNTLGRIKCILYTRVHTDTHHAHLPLGASGSPNAAPPRPQTHPNHTHRGTLPQGWCPFLPIPHMCNLLTASKGLAHTLTQGQALRPPKAQPPHRSQGSRPGT